MTVPILTEPEMDKYQNLDASALPQRAVGA